MTQVSADQSFISYSCGLNGTLKSVFQCDVKNCISTNLTTTKEKLIQIVQQILTRGINPQYSIAPIKNCFILKTLLVILCGMVFSIL